jgi:ketosteroid isomerase-like protein
MWLHLERGSAANDGGDLRMVPVADLDRVIQQCQLALREFVKGNPEPMQMMFSHQDDVTLANPIAPPALGWKQVAATMERAASNIRDGEITGFETVAKHVTPELAYVVWVEHNMGKIGGREDIAPFDLRVTMIFRPEDGTWKIVHRHADTVTTARPVESLIHR